MVKINKSKNINNKNDIWLSFLGESSVKQGNQDYFGAIEALTKAININNKYPIPIIRRAKIRFEIKDYKNANEDLRKAFKEVDKKKRSTAISEIDTTITATGKITTVVPNVEVQSNYNSVVKEIFVKI